MTDHPATRLLAMLELLQTHRRLSGDELATRLQVDRRTVRRYISLLEEMGIPITTQRGRHGGYELVAGFKLPPMMFTNDEVVALALGLAAVRGVESATRPAIESARSKLERVMPEGLKSRLRSVAESVEFAPRPEPGLANTAALSVLSVCAYERRGVHLRYRASSGARSEREFDPYGLAFTAGRWYVAGYCHLRKQLRTFRLDRVESAAAQTRGFERPDDFDALGHLAFSIATLPRKFSIEVLLDTDLDSARRELFPAIGILEPRGEIILLHSQADDLDWFARELARLPWRFKVRKPPELKEAVRRHARALLARRAF